MTKELETEKHSLCIPNNSCSSDAGRKLFLGGLKFGETEETVKKAFEAFGEVEEVQIPRDKDSGKSRGFGFVTFTDSAVVRKLAVTGTHSLNGRIIDLRVAKPKRNSLSQLSESNSSTNNSKSSFNEQSKMRKKHSTNSTEHPNGSIDLLTNRIFVGGLPNSVTNLELKQYFSKFGTVMDTFVLLNPATKRPRGFGFVSFKDKSVVKSVLKQSHEIFGKKVETRLATTRAEKKVPTMPTPTPLPAASSTSGSPQTDASVNYLVHQNIHPQASIAHPSQILLQQQNPFSLYQSGVYHQQTNYMYGPYYPNFVSYPTYSPMVTSNGHIGVSLNFRNIPQQTTATVPQVVHGHSNVTNQPSK